MKVAVVTPIPTPYRDPFWNHVAADPLVELDVFYCSAGKQDRPWEVSWRRDFRWETLPGRNLLAWRGADSSCYWNPEISARLSGGKYDAIVIGGYNHPTMLSSVAFAERTGTPYFMMCETYQRRQSSKWKSALKRLLVRHVMKHAAGTFPTGKLSGEYVVRFGASPAGVVSIPNVPDVETLNAESARLRSLRTGDERPVVLFVGRLIPKKRAGLLIRAFARTPAAERAQLVIVGSGPEQASLEHLVAELNVCDRVQFAGFAQPQDVVKWYSMANVFVLPSSETWGVSAIEALSCRAPVIVTNEVGCHPDVVTDDRVGRVVAAGDEQELSGALNEMLSRSPGPEEVDSAWRSTRQGFRYDALTERFVNGLRKGLTAA